jgi:hypothetical protein
MFFDLRSSSIQIALNSLVITRRAAQWRWALRLRESRTAAEKSLGLQKREGPPMAAHMFRKSLLHCPLAAQNHAK